MDPLTSTLALVGAVIIVAAILSGLIERSRFPQVAAFLALGAILGPAGLQLVDLHLGSPLIKVVAILSLVLVLFTDAVALNISEVKSHLKLAGLILGPATIVSATLMTLAGWTLLGLSLPMAMILGAALASTDPVMLRPLIKRKDLPAAAGHALRLESGLNDAVLLPVIIVGMMLASAGDNAGKWGALVTRLFLLGPAAGVIVALVSIGLLELVRKKLGVRRDYESLYSLGVAFAAYAAAESVHGSGFLAAFTAGVTIASLDVELCDCFVEYGETTAEMALLFTFVLFGSSLIWQGISILNFKTFLYALVVLLIRPLILLLTLSASGVDRRSLFIISWFGPRGLSSLLLVLLPFFAGISGSEQLFAVASLVVLLSVVVHGASMMLLKEEKDKTASPVIGEIRSPAGYVEAVDVAKLRELQQSADEVHILDVRSERGYQDSSHTVENGIRVSPDDPVKELTEKGISKEAWLIAFCA